MGMSNDNLAIEIARHRQTQEKLDAAKVTIANFESDAYVLSLLTKLDEVEKVIADIEEAIKYTGSEISIRKTINNYRSKK
jgi:hypothetical protein